LSKTSTGVEENNNSKSRVDSTFLQLSLPFFNLVVDFAFRSVKTAI